ncbi:MAG: frataxin family protein [Alphaproteobacteria bacterium]
MDKKNLLSAMKHTMDDLFSRCDDVLGERADLSYDGSVLSLVFDAGGTAVINLHQASGQIWVSSPISGAHHFSLREDGTWASATTTLAQVMEKDFGVVLGD